MNIDIEKKNIWIWGVGAAGKWAADNITSNIKGFIDSGAAKQNIKYNNGLLKINADFNDKGSLKVTVLNKRGKEIAISKTIKKTSMNQIVQFDRKITENNISLKFTINDAKLYSFLIGK